MVTPTVIDWRSLRFLVGDGVRMVGDIDRGVARQVSVRRLAFLVSDDMRAGGVAVVVCVFGAAGAGVKLARGGDACSLRVCLSCD